MSCFRCGKELPEGQVECESTCDEVIEQKIGEVNLAKFTEKRCPEMILIELHLNTAKHSPEMSAALVRFSQMLGEILVNSKLTEFLKKKP